jgi:CheY-like chemotaxis protein
MSPRRTLLFIDDDREFLQAQVALFSKRGFEVLTADSTQAALAALDARTPDLVVLDLMMEHYDSGFALSHRLRQNPKWSKLPIIMLSGVARETGHKFGEEEALASWSKLTAFLDKPVTFQQLLKVIEQHLAPTAAEAAQEA